MEAKYPDIEVPMVGQDGNAFEIMSRVTSAMKEHVGPGEVFETRQEARQAAEEYREEAMSGDYDNLLSVTMRTVTIL